MYSNHVLQSSDDFRIFINDINKTEHRDSSQESILECCLVMSFVVVVFLCVSYYL